MISHLQHYSRNQCLTFKGDLPCQPSSTHPAIFLSRSPDLNYSIASLAASKLYCVSSDAIFDCFVHDIPSILFPERKKTITDYNPRLYIFFLQAKKRIKIYRHTNNMILLMGALKRFRFWVFISSFYPQKLINIFFLCINRNILKLKNT